MRIVSQVARRFLEFGSTTHLAASLRAFLLIDSLSVVEPTLGEWL